MASCFFRIEEVFDSKDVFIKYLSKFIGTWGIESNKNAKFLKNTPNFLVVILEICLKKWPKSFKFPGFFLPLKELLVATSVKRVHSLPENFYLN